MEFPNYKDESIVNLMASIGRKFKYNSKYNDLKHLSSNELKKYDKIILFVIDGLGYEFIKDKGKKSFMEKCTENKITSVFPSTTSSAMTSYISGDAPAEHGLTGWFMNLKEVGAISAILPLSPRFKYTSYCDNNYIDINKIINFKAFTAKIKTKSIVYYPEYIANSHFSKKGFEKAKVEGYKNKRSLFAKLKKEIKNKENKYVFAYLDEFDTFSHINGQFTNKTKKFYNEIDENVKKLAKKLDEKTLLIISADHGQIDNPKNKRITLRTLL